MIPLLHMYMIPLLENITMISMMHMISIFLNDICIYIYIYVYKYKYIYIYLISLLNMIGPSRSFGPWPTPHV